MPVAVCSEAHGCNTVSRLLLQSSDAGSACCSATPFLGLAAGGTGQQVEGHEANACAQPGGDDSWVYIGIMSLDRFG